MAERAASTNCSLLITGATGTGKGHLARWIHNHSARASLPFVPVNCGAIPEQLVDSHLFGHARGSFSGADNEHLGLVRAANGGTLLLDEITELPASAQMRLLRLLEEREVQPVGYSKPVNVNVRIIAATNGDLQQAVQRGAFRQDLYFRLDVVRLHLKSLHERQNEIAGLIDEFNAEFAAMYEHDRLILADDAMAALERYDWPGNVRELRTVIERLHVLCGETRSAISVEELRTFGQLRNLPLSRPRSATMCVQEFRLQAISDTMQACRGNVSRAAVKLGVHRSTIYRWLANQSVATA